MSHPERIYMPHVGPQIARPQPDKQRGSTTYQRVDEQMLSMFADMMINSMAGREPDFIIGGADDPYIKRWWLRKDADTCSIYLHQIIRDDDDRALHDHPWDSTSLILRGQLREILPDGERLLCPGSITWRPATEAHRLEVADGPVWSLFMTGPRVREWGFHCPQGWRHWKVFTDPATDGATIGRGCE